MSDAFYQERAARRTRTLWIAAGLLGVVVCVVAGVAGLFYDACTQSFDRSSQAVVAAYVDAIRRSDAAAAQKCWEHGAFYDLEAGCSEICLSRLYGVEYEVAGLELGAPSVTAEGRANLTATVSVVCTGGEEHWAEIVLDSVAHNAPWKHWAIVYSDFGGTVAEQWCK